ncbi:hypothetical protein ES705_02706 [subsurface metagenome]
MSDSGIISIKIDLIGIGSVFANIIRHYAPFSADAILNKMPFVLKGRFSFGAKKYWTLPGLELYKGLNSKSIKKVEKGDIIYNPKTDELIILIESTEMPNKVNKIGEVTENLVFFLQARNGLGTKLSRVK